MAERRHRFGLIDLIAVVVSPVLVMLMVGSLVFFLVEVLYQGKYTGRMLYTMFFYVFACVLLARLSIQFGRARASAYMLALGCVTLLALTAYSSMDGSLKVFSPIINLGLMVLIWWSADKLTWDCTDFDEARKASGRGVLAAAGLDDSAGPAEPEPEPEQPEPKLKRQKKDEPFIGWVERYKQYRAEQKKKPHTPGVWVLWFSLAALPLFALGQSLIDPEDTATRRATFFDMAVYVGSGLGLLVTTTLFGLKRYIEERGANVPPIMTTSWLVMGGGLILVFLTVGALLPRPHSETALFGLDRGEKTKRQASKNAVVRDSSAGEGEGAAGKKTEAGDGKGSAKGGKEGGGKSGEKGGGGGKGKSDGGKQQDGSKGNNTNGKNAGQGKEQKGDANKQQSKDKSKNDQDQGGNNASNEDKSENKDSESGDDAKDAENQSDSGSDPASQISKMAESIGSFVKWIVWIIIAVAVIVGLAFFFLKWLAPFTNWARNLLDWLKGLFARKPKAPTAREEAAAVAEIVRRTPFAAFDNPFTDGTARHRTPAELVEYTFAAFDAWAWDRDCGREPGETPLEFAIRIGHEWAELDEPAFQTANLYVRVLYSRSPLPADTLKVLAAFWKQLETAAVPA